MNQERQMLFSALRLAERRLENAQINFLVVSSDEHVQALREAESDLAGVKKTIINLAAGKKGKRIMRRKLGYQYTRPDAIARCVGGKNI